MSDLMSLTVLEMILSVFFIALAVTVVFRMLRLSVILGYLLVGALVGPHAFGLVPDSEYIKQIAEFGIVFLMFTVGLEFSLPKLFALKYSVFVIGGLQVISCVVITTLVGAALGMHFLSALVAGSIVAMSSTAIVVKQLHDQHELQSPFGLNAIGVLLFQDLAVIPLIILIAGLADTGKESLTSILFWALANGICAILLIFVMGRWLLRPLFHLISRTRSIELFTLSVLLVTLTSAWLTHILGLSFALGAFLAGIMLAETEFRHQIEIEVRPFRDILLGLFFITIGMLANVTTWLHTWFWIAFLVFALVIGKMAVIILISRLSGNSTSTALRTGLVLAQGGEFGFAILTLALSENIIPAEQGQIILAGLLISIAIAPLLIFFNKKIAHFFAPKKDNLTDPQIQQQITERAQLLKNHVIICGYGRVGQHVARLLEKVSFPCVSIDFDSELVHRAGLAGEDVLYGDAAHPEFLKKAGIAHAKVLVISLSDHRVATAILTMARNLYPKLPILVRCRDKAELQHFKELGATEIIAELFEASLTLSNHLLQLIQLPREKVADVIQKIRSSDYELLQQVYTGDSEDEPTDSDAPLPDQLRPVLITENAYAIGKTLGELDLRHFHVEVVAIRHEQAKQSMPLDNVKIYVGDILILSGLATNVELAEQRILEG